MLWKGSLHNSPMCCAITVLAQLTIELFDNKPIATIIVVIWKNGIGIAVIRLALYMEISFYLPATPVFMGNTLALKYAFFYLANKGHFFLLTNKFFCSTNYLSMIVATVLHFYIYVKFLHAFYIFFTALLKFEPAAQQFRSKKMIFFFIYKNLAQLQ